MDGRGSPRPGPGRHVDAMCRRGNGQGIEVRILTLPTPMDTPALAARVTTSPRKRFVHNFTSRFAETRASIGLQIGINRIGYLGQQQAVAEVGQRNITNAAARPPRRRRPQAERCQRLKPR